MSPDETLISSMERFKKLFDEVPLNTIELKDAIFRTTDRLPMLKGNPRIGANVSVMPLLTYLNLGLGELSHIRLTVELADKKVKYPKGIAENVLVGIGKFTFLIDFIILDILEDIKVPLNLGRPFLSTTHAKIDVYKRKITLRVDVERIIFKSGKPASSLIKRVYMLSLREKMELNLEARLMGETLLSENLYGIVLMPTIEEGKVIEEFRTSDDDLDTGIDDYLSYCDDDKKIHIDCAHNLKFSCMIGFEFTHVNFYPLLYVNGSWMLYRDEGICNIIVGEPFLREVGIKTKCLEGIVTLYNGDDEVTYQMDSDAFLAHDLTHKRNLENLPRIYGVSVPAFTKDHKGIKLNMPYPEDQYAILEIWNEYNILEDIKRVSYSKKSPICRIQSLDTPYRTDFQTL
ncbi:putative reverse transcriptase domain-containing protein [Tanacetum coccineum]